MLDLKYLFKFDVIKQAKNSKCNIHFINEDMDPTKPPIIKMYTIDNKCIDGFIRMVKYQLNHIANRKVIYEIRDNKN